MQFLFKVRQLTYNTFSRVLYFSDKKDSVFESLRKSIEALCLPGFVEVRKSPKQKAIIAQPEMKIVIYFQIICNFKKILAIEVRFHDHARYPMSTDQPITYKAHTV